MSSTVQNGNALDVSPILHSYEPASVLVAGKQNTKS